jgi:hypothetical protein
MGIGFLSLITGYWSLITNHWSLVTNHWFSVRELLGHGFYALPLGLGVTDGFDVTDGGVPN